MSVEKGMAVAPLTGRSSPLGTTTADGGVNFSLFSRTASGVELLLFDREDEASPARVVRLDQYKNHTYHYWHVFVQGVRPGQIYGYRVEGPSAPERGLRFDPAKVLLDPYGRGVVVPKTYDREAAKRPGDTSATAMKSVVVDPSAYDWEGDALLCLPSARTVIYEMHVRGFTRHPSSGVGEKTRGTYTGLIEKIPYLKDLGVTAVELLPVFQFDPQDAPPGKINYWGYAPISFFAPHQAYSSRQDPLGPVRRVSGTHGQSTSTSSWTLRSFSTWCSTTPPRGITLGRRSASRASTRRPTTSSKTVAHATPTTLAAVTRSMPIIRS